MATVFEMNGQTWSIVVELVKLKLNISGELLMHPDKNMYGTDGIKQA
jgi:hypothetical protein